MLIIFEGITYTTTLMITFLQDGTWAFLFIYVLLLRHANVVVFNLYFDNFKETQIYIMLIHLFHLDPKITIILYSSKQSHKLQLYTDSYSTHVPNSYTCWLYQLYMTEHHLTFALAKWDYHQQKIDVEFKKLYYKS